MKILPQKCGTFMMIDYDDMYARVCIKYAAVCVLLCAYYIIFHFIITLKLKFVTVKKGYYFISGFLLSYSYYGKGVESRH